MRSPLRSAGRGLTAVALVFVGSLGGVVASHAFPDVPEDNPFHDEIAEFAAAQCADGFPDGTFHPTDAVKRQQMARFFTRCGGRIIGDGEISQTTSTSGAPVTLITRNVNAPADGFVLAVAYVDVLTPNETLCACEVHATIRQNATTAADAQGSLQGENDADGDSRTSLAPSAVIPVQANQPKTIDLRANFVDNNTPSVTFSGRMQLLFVPFALA